MEKCWFLLIEGQKKGPFSFWDLKEMPELTPDTLAWKEGMESWLPIRKIPELAKLFKDEEEEEEPLKPKISLKEESAITLDFVEPPFFLWLIFVLAVLSYVIFQLYHGS